MRSLVLAFALLLALSACADDAPAASDLEVVTVQPARVEDSAFAAPDTARVPQADAPADASPPAARAPGAPAADPAPSPAVADRRPAPAAEPDARLRTVAVTVTASAFEPSRITLDAGAPARLVFTRTSDRTCATQVVFPSLGIGPVDLPLGEPVSVDVPAGGPGEIAFACGMDMLRGSLVVGP
jgi:hypothetical protein